MARNGDNIHKRKDGRWEGRCRYKSSDGNYKYKSIYGKSYCEVQERMKDVIAQLEKNYQSIENKISIETKTDIFFNEVAEKWLDQIREIRKYSTYIKYSKLYESHIKNAMDKAKISDISNNFINVNIFNASCKKNISASTKQSIIFIINQILHYASEYYDCPEIKLSNKYMREHNKRIEIINHSEQALLLRYLSQDIDLSKAGIILCISTGLRLGEICSLKWKDIDLEQMIIHISRTVQRIASLDTGAKTSLMITSPKSIFSLREIPISKEIKALLNQMSQMQTGPYVLGGDKPLEPRTYQNRFKKYLRDVKIKEYNFHAIRHTFATNCIDSGMDIKSLSEILGHCDVRITLNRYVHPTMETKRKHISVLTSSYGQYCSQLDATKQ